jgi:hypothetical protein
MIQAQPPGDIDHVTIGDRRVWSNAIERGTMHMVRRDAAARRDRRSFEQRMVRRVDRGMNVERIHGIAGDE